MAGNNQPETTENDPNYRQKGPDVIELSGHRVPGPNWVSPYGFLGETLMVGTSELTILSPVYN